MSLCWCSKPLEIDEKDGILKWDQNKSFKISFVVRNYCDLKTGQNIEPDGNKLTILQETGN